MADADAIVVGAGLAGLVAATELAAAGKQVILLDQEPEGSLGGQAWWSLGGLFLVNSVQQRRLRIDDSHELALDDWRSTAGFDRPEDEWPRRWAEAYIASASGEMQDWVCRLGLRFFPIVGWAERRRHGAPGPGNSVPRFHLTWGTGPAVLAPFQRRIREAAAEGLVRLLFRHRVDGLTVQAGAITGVEGAILEPSTTARGQPTSQAETGGFRLRAGAVIVASGGIGGNLALVKECWPQGLGAHPRNLLTGVPAHVDGRMFAIASGAGASIINRDRMWHYNEGVQNWDPIWPNHGIRILPGPSSLWIDAEGKRLPDPLFPGFDTLGALTHIRSTGFDHTWFVLNQAIVRREFALSGSEQNPDLTGRDLQLLVERLLSRRAAAGPVEAFKRKGIDFVVAGNISRLIEGMNRIAGEPLLSERTVVAAVESREQSERDGRVTDGQMREVHRARSYLHERLFRVASPGRLLDTSSSPLIAVRLRMLTRKTLGGLHTDLEARVLDRSGSPIPGVFAAGEAAGFGGGGMHGYRALEGTFLGGCLFSGRIAGRAAAR